MARRLMVSILVAVVTAVCTLPAWAGKDKSNLSTEEKAVVEALIFNLIRQRQQQPPPPPPPPPPPEKNPPPEGPPEAPPDGPQGDGPVGN